MASARSCIRLRVHAVEVEQLLRLAVVSPRFQAEHVALGAWLRSSHRLQRREGPPVTPISTSP